MDTEATTADWIRSQQEAFLERFRKHPKYAEWMAELPCPENSALIEFSFGASYPTDSRAEHRCYYVRATDKPNGYRSVAYGMIFYTDQTSGPSGEPIIQTSKWIIIDGTRYVGDFPAWENVVYFIKHGMHGSVKQVAAD